MVTEKVKKSIKKYAKRAVPYGIMEKYFRKVSMNNENLTYQKHNEIRNYFLALNIDEQSADVIEIINWFKENKFSVFPYDFTRKYLTKHTDVFYDNSCEMCFVLHDGKKLYFPKGWWLEASSLYYNVLLSEQDEQSPHRYETENFTVKNGEIIADIGAAEGIWALTNVEKASKIYLFECEKPWIRALQKTFEPWKEKIAIVNRYVSDVNTKNEITIDEYFRNKEIDFIKADIEGAEVKLLEGGKEILSRENDLKLLLCAYHRKDDAVKLKEILDANGFSTEFTKRYMIFIHDSGLEEPYIRRGLIRAKKKLYL